MPLESHEHAPRSLRTQLKEDRLVSERTVWSVDSFLPFVICNTMEVLPTEDHANVLLLDKTTRRRRSVHNDEMGGREAKGRA